MLIALPALASPAQADVLMQRYDKGRNGRAVDANITPSSFSDGKWQRLGPSLVVDGAVYAQPLLLQNKLMSDNVTHDVLYVATARNKIYAFDANSQQLIWSKQPIRPGTSTPAQPDLADENILDEFGNLSGCAAMSPTYLPADGNEHPSVADYGIGIQSTPVLDPAAAPNGYMYFTYRSNAATPPTLAASKQFIAKMDLKTGAITSAEITPAHLNQPVSAVRQRASLLLHDGIVYVAFASHCEEKADEGDPAFQYRGKLLAFDAISLNHVGTFTTLPEAPAAQTTIHGGGIWHASSGVAADSNGNLFFMTGNALPGQPILAPGLQSNGTYYLPSAFVKVQAVRSPASGQAQSVTFTNVDYFRPWRAIWQDLIDLDLGSAGVLLPPGSSQLVGGGKEGILYVLNRSSLGHAASNAWDDLSDVPNCAKTAPDLLNLCHAPCFTPDATNPETGVVVQKWPAALNMDCATPHMNNWMGWAHIHGTPVYGTINGNDYLYIFSERGQIKAFRRATATPLTFDANGAFIGEATAPNMGMPGGMLTLSTNAANSSGVLFAAVPQVDSATGAAMRGALLAFDATPVTGPGNVRTLKQLWGDYELVNASNQRDLYLHAKFVPPTVANGKVYLATFSNKVNVYGRTTVAPVASARSNIGSLLYNSSAHSVVSMFVQPDGRIRVFGENSDGPWQSFGTLGNANEFPPDAPLALDLQTATRKIAVLVGNDGKLHVFRTEAATINASTSWTHDVVNVATSMPAGAPIAIRHRGSEVNAFLIDAAGDMHRYWVVGSATSWQDQKLTASAKFPLRAGVASDYQNSGLSSWLDVFAVADTGALWAFAANNVAGASFGSGSAVPGTSYVPGAKIATGHQGSDRIDVFIIGGKTGGLVDPDNFSCSGAYNNCSGFSDVSQDGALNVISAVGFGPATVRSLKRLGHDPGVPGGSVVAISQGSNQLDVFFVGQNGALQFYAVQGTGDGWFNGELPLNALPGAPLSVVPQSLSGGAPLQIDLLAPETHGIFGTFVTGMGSWFPAIKML